MKALVFLFTEAETQVKTITEKLREKYAQYAKKTASKKIVKLEEKYEELVVIDKNIDQLKFADKTRLKKIYDYATPELYEHLYEKSVVFSTLWFKSKKYQSLNDALKFKNVSIPFSLEMPTEYYLTRIIEFIDLINNAIEQEKPDMVYIQDKIAYFGLVEDVCKAKGINHTFLVPKILANITEKLKTKLKTSKVELAIKPSEKKDELLLKNQLLFYPIAESTVDTLKALSSKVVKDKKFTCYALVPDNWKNYDFLKEITTIKFIFAGDFITKENIAEVEIMFQKLTSLRSSIETAMQDTMVYKNINMAKYLINGFLPSFFIEALRVIESIVSLENVLKILEPSCFLSFQDKSTKGRPAVLTAKNRNIPTLIIHNGCFEVNPVITYINTDLDEEKKLIKWDILADHWVLLDKGQKDGLVLRGIPQYKLHAIGIPRFDTLYTRTQSFDKSFYVKKYSILENKKVILFAAQPPGEEDRSTLGDKTRLLKILCESLATIKDAFIIIKPHPKDNYVDQYNVPKILADAKLEGTLVAKNEDIFNLIMTSDLIITAFSTTAVEAMLANKPVITINLSGKPDPIYFGNTPSIHKEEEIPMVAKRVLEDGLTQEEQKSLSKYLKPFFENFDNRCTERNIKLIYRLCNKQTAKEEEDEI